MHIPLSVLGQRWQLSQDSWRTGVALAQATGLPGVVAQVLVARGITDSVSASIFLNPRLDQLPDPLSLNGMEEAVTIITDALQSDHKIAIFGDYDVDGVCATALLARYLRTLGADPLLYIPERLTEGYGPNPQAMQTLHQQGVQLLITVDTGTNAQAALQEAQKLGMKVLVTDHHPPEGELPPAAAILNPHRKDDTSSLQGLCGSGVVFYLLMALNRHLREVGFFNGKTEPKLSQVLDLVGLATVADVMPLTGINRVLVARGLQQLGTWQHRGLAALAGVAGLRDDLSASTMSFGLAPRLNAAGRIDSARTALNLLLSESDEEATQLARSLNDLNVDRQQLEKAILAEARAQAEQQMAADAPLGLVLYGAKWHPGVAGIVATRIKEQFNRPTFILGADANQHLKGSGRSTPHFNLGGALQACKTDIISGGGHAMAAGVTLLEENLENFRTHFHQALQQQLDAKTEDQNLPLTERLAPILKLEATITCKGLTPQFAQTLQQLAPFGMGNHEPVLVLSDVHVRYSRPVGSTQEHLKLTLSDTNGQAKVEAIAFGACAPGNPLGPLLTNSGGRALTLAVVARPRTFNGQNMLDVQIKDAHPNFEISAA